MRVCGVAIDPEPRVSPLPPGHLHQAGAGEHTGALAVPSAVRRPRRAEAEAAMGRPAG